MCRATMAGSRFVRFAAIGGAFLVFSAAAAAQRSIASLKGVAMPQRPDLARYVADEQTLVVVGKALFWDVQIGSDGRTACATCHFHAGAHHRVTNELAPPAASAAAVRPNTTLTAADFPFHAFSNPNDNGSPATRDRREIVGSAGVVKRTFVDVSDDSAVDIGADAASAGVVGGLPVRQVTSRNTPTVINAVFNLRTIGTIRAVSLLA